MCTAKPYFVSRVRQRLTGVNNEQQQRELVAIGQRQGEAVGAHSSSAMIPKWGRQNERDRRLGRVGRVLPATAAAPCALSSTCSCVGCCAAFEPGRKYENRDADPECADSRILIKTSSCWERTIDRLVKPQASSIKPLSSMQVDSGATEYTQKLYEQLRYDDVWNKSRIAWYVKASQVLVNRALIEKLWLLVHATQLLGILWINMCDALCSPCSHLSTMFVALKTPLFVGVRASCVGQVNFVVKVRAEIRCAFLSRHTSQRRSCAGPFSTSPR